MCVCLVLTSEDVKRDVAHGPLIAEAHGVIVRGGRLLEGLLLRQHRFSRLTTVRRHMYPLDLVVQDDVQSPVQVTGQLHGAAHPHFSCRLAVDPKLQVLA